MTDNYRSDNRKLWNTWALHHPQTTFYDVASFRAGKTTLRPVELAELGDISGKTLLHLQCHFGMDTLSWAREGAIVTGMDFAEEAIKQAQTLSTELDIPARFIRSDLYDLPNVLDEQFDIVFTSYGVLFWMPDIDDWARVVANFVRPGGTFYIAEFHPFAQIFDDDATLDTHEIKYDYFHSPEPDSYESTGSYADPDMNTPALVSHGWQHSLGDIITTLINNGLQIEFLHEFPFTYFQQNAMLERHADGWWHPKAGQPTLPLMFSLKATKPA